MSELSEIILRKDITVEQYQKILELFIEDDSELLVFLYATADLVHMSLLPREVLEVVREIAKSRIKLLGNLENVLDSGQNEQIQ